MADAAIWTPMLVLIPTLTFWAYSLIDFSRTPEHEMRTFPRDTWLVIITFGSVLGCIAWWRVGRPDRS